MKLLCNFQENFSDVNFSQEEKLLLCLAALLHDLGCILGRQDHAKKSIKILEHERFGFVQDMIGDDLLTCLKYIILSHPSSYDLNELPINPIHADVRLNLICAIFKLLDECELSSARVTHMLYDILKTFSKIRNNAVKYWEAHINIISVVFKNNVIYIGSKNPEKTKMLTDHFKKELRKVNKIFLKENFPMLHVKIWKMRENFYQ
jgi:exopolyphosphatase/pppGpp-phosphohydrolase